MYSLLDPPAVVGWWREARSLWTSAQLRKRPATRSGRALESQCAALRASLLTTWSTEPRSCLPMFVSAPSCCLSLSYSRFRYISLPGRTGAPHMLKGSKVAGRFRLFRPTRQDLYWARPAASQKPPQSQKRIGYPPPPFSARPAASPKSLRGTWLWLTHPRFCGSFFRRAGGVLPRRRHHALGRARAAHGGRFWRIAKLTHHYNRTAKYKRYMLCL